MLGQTNQNLNSKAFAFPAKMSHHQGAKTIPLVTKQQVHSNWIPARPPNVISRRELVSGGLNTAVALGGMFSGPKEAQASENANLVPTQGISSIQEFEAFDNLIGSYQDMTPQV